MADKLARARTHIKAIAKEIRDTAASGDGTAVQLFTSGMLNGLLASDQICGGASAEQALEFVESSIAAVVGRAFLDGTLKLSPATTTEGEAARCVCGEPSTAGTVHRTDGPCYQAEPALAPELREQYAAAIRVRLQQAAPTPSPWRGEIGVFGAATEYDLADDVLAVRDTELQQLRDQVERARAFAEEMRGYCSPHGVSVMYANRLLAALDPQEQP